MYTLYFNLLMTTYMQNNSYNQAIPFLLVEIRKKVLKEKDEEFKMDILPIIFFSQMQ